MAMRSERLDEFQRRLMLAPPARSYDDIKRSSLSSTSQKMASVSPQFARPRARTTSKGTVWAMIDTSQNLPTRKRTL